MGERKGAMVWGSAAEWRSRWACINYLKIVFRYI